MNEKKYILHTDGGARGNPGPAAGAAILFDANYRQIDKICKYLGKTTNNQAEYTGLLLGLALAHQHGAKNILVKMDSELVVKQIIGEYRIKDASLKILAAKANKMLTEFAQYNFEHVRREKNKDADALVNKTLDNH
jgi:ribonuclease HI